MEGSAMSEDTFDPRADPQPDDRADRADQPTQPPRVHLCAHHSDLLAEACHEDYALALATMHWLWIARASDHLLPVLYADWRALQPDMPRMTHHFVVWALRSRCFRYAAGCPFCFDNRFVRVPPHEVEDALLYRVIGRWTLTRAALAPGERLHLPSIVYAPHTLPHRDDLLDTGAYLAHIIASVEPSRLN
jgi:hypothetical protein